MACYSNSCKSNSAKIVMVISFMILILGVVTAIFGAIQMGVVQKKDTFTSAEIDLSGFGNGVLGLGLLTILLSVFGLLTAKYKKAYFSIPFIISTLIAGIIFLILATFILGLGSAVFAVVKGTACQ